MKFYKVSILAIMMAAAALFACSEQPGPDGRAAQETDEQPRAYMGDEDKKGVDNQQDGMNTQDDTGNVNQPQVQQPPQQDRQ